MSAAAIELLLLCVALAGGYLQPRYRTRRLKREQFVRQYVFSAALLNTLTKGHSCGGHGCGGGCGGH
jgi:hypothetical protein